MYRRWCQFVKRVASWKKVSIFIIIIIIIIVIIIIIISADYQVARERNCSTHW